MWGRLNRPATPRHFAEPRDNPEFPVDLACSQRCSKRHGWVGPAAAVDGPQRSPANTGLIRALLALACGLGGAQLDLAGGSTGSEAVQHPDLGFSLAVSRKVRFSYRDNHCKHYSGLQPLRLRHNLPGLQMRHKHYSRLQVFRSQVSTVHVRHNRVSL